MVDTASKLCTECHKADPNNQYWDFGEEVYCQMCWEDHCSKTYYETFGW